MDSSPQHHHTDFHGIIESILRPPIINHSLRDSIRRMSSGQSSVRRMSSGQSSVRSPTMQSCRFTGGQSNIRRMSSGQSSGIYQRNSISRDNRTGPFARRISGRQQGERRDETEAVTQSSTSSKKTDPQIEDSSDCKSSGMHQEESKGKNAPVAEQSFEVNGFDSPINFQSNYKLMMVQRKGQKSSVQYHQDQILNQISQFINDF